MGYLKPAAWLGAFLATAACAMSAGAQIMPSTTDMAGKAYPIPDDTKYLHWPLAPADAKYGKLDGMHIKSIVSEITAISRRDRDRGNPWWGRNSGTQADKETQQWLMAKFKAAGLVNVHLQEFDIPPHWVPKSWDATVTGSGTSAAKLTSLRPFLWSNPTPPGGLELEPVYISLGDPADLQGRDLKGKAAFILAIPQPGMRDNSALYNNSMQRAQAAGAAVVVVALQMPGNVTSQMISSSGVTVPNFSIGMRDMLLVRTMIEENKAPKIRFNLATEMATGQKTATVWGELPGATDEDMLMMAHTDAFFDGALDNASGMATMVALAEYYAKIPQAQRRRTLRFAGVPGHHIDQNKPANLPASGSEGTRWMADNKDSFFKKTALIINFEHVAQTVMQPLGPDVIAGNTTSPLPWSVFGSDTFKKIAHDSLDQSGVAIFAIPEKRPGGELGRIHTFAPSMQLIDRILYHSEMDVDQYVPAYGLERVARAYAKIIDGVNKVALKDLKGPPEAP
jgi:hypothetical protein